MLNHNDNDATDEDLTEYAKNFKRWCKELKQSLLTIDYSNYYSDYTAVTCTFNRYCKKNYSNSASIFATNVWKPIGVKPCRAPLRCHADCMRVSARSLLYLASAISSILPSLQMEHIDMSWPVNPQIVHCTRCTSGMCAMMRSCVSAGVID